MDAVDAEGHRKTADTHSLVAPTAGNADRRPVFPGAKPSRSVDRKTGLMTG